MSINNAIGALMKRHLVLQGYPADEVRFDLGYCQGDGASFIGRLDVKRLAARLAPEIHPAVWDGLTLSDALEITRDSGCRYVHERSTSVSIDPVQVELTPAEELGGPAQKVALHRLVTALVDDVVSTGAELARQGYKLLDAYVSEESSLRRFETQNFRVEVSKCPEEDYDIFESDTDLEYLDHTIQQVLSEEIECFCVKVKVAMLGENGDVIAVLAERNVGGLTRDPAINGLCSDTREMVREAIAEARESYLKLLKPRLRQAA
ncbi:hypothetical protein [Pseudomonas sp. Irchel 3E13]|uniref:hypothetical protein n=1 Tax=Pseudomonas sp. Irchel 3E13 TaxID=2008975 RepID=UPI000BA40A9B|nr:hypothetical protein [Pseudomonas sp. Irchel 3E13]